MDIDRSPFQCPAEMLINGESASCRRRGCKQNRARSDTARFSARLGPAKQTKRPVRALAPANKAYTYMHARAGRTRSALGAAAGPKR